MRDVKLLSPFKFRDPYISDGSRIPRTSKASKKSHLFDEINWKPHFTIMHSKNNEKLHPAYKEFFDSPVNYEVKGHQFSARIPPGKVYENRFGTGTFSLRTSRFQRELETEQKLFKGASRSIMQTTRKDISRKEVRNILHDQKIPYLRESKVKSPKLSSREKSWSSATGYPISKYNETVYPYYKLMFEHI